jgi:hypothetical protein
MKKRILTTRILIALFVAVALIAPALAQTSSLPLPTPVEKELASRATNVTEVTLGKNMLAFAAKFMEGKDRRMEQLGEIRGIAGLGDALSSVQHTPRGMERDKTRARDKADKDTTDKDKSKDKSRDKKDGEQ